MSSRLGMAMVGGRAGDQPRERPAREGAQLNDRPRSRPAGDFFPTPPEATHALVEWLNSLEALDPREAIYEPACGDGAMARVIESYGFEIIASDLADRGFGVKGVDFLRLQFPRASQIITNPPYGDDLPDRFIRVALGERKARLLCLLLKATFWNAGPGQKGKPPRDALWRDHRPNAVLALTWRPDFMGLGRPTMDCAWNVWIDKPAWWGVTVYDRLKRPSSTAELFAEAGNRQSAFAKATADRSVLRDADLRSAPQDEERNVTGRSPARPTGRPQAPRAQRAISAEGLNAKKRR